MTTALEGGEGSESINTAKKRPESLVVTLKKIGLEINVEKTKDMLISRDQNAG